jgi:hypothetical protein
MSFGMPIKYDMSEEEITKAMDNTNAFVIKGPSINIDL